MQPLLATATSVAGYPSVADGVAKAEALQADGASLKARNTCGDPIIAVQFVDSTGDNFAVCKAVYYETYLTSKRPQGFSYCTEELSGCNGDTLGRAIFMKSQDVKITTRKQRHAADVIEGGKRGERSSYRENSTKELRHLHYAPRKPWQEPQMQDSKRAAEGQDRLEGGTVEIEEERKAPYATIILWGKVGQKLAAGVGRSAGCNTALLVGKYVNRLYKANACAHLVCISPTSTAAWKISADPRNNPPIRPAHCSALHNMVLPFPTEMWLDIFHGLAKEGEYDTLEGCRVVCRGFQLMADECLAYNMTFKSPKYVERIKVNLSGDAGEFRLLPHTQLETLFLGRMFDSKFPRPSSSFVELSEFIAASSHVFAKHGLDPRSIPVHSGLPSGLVAVELMLGFSLHSDPRSVTDLVDFFIAIGTSKELREIKIHSTPSFRTTTQSDVCFNRLVSYSGQSLRRLDLEPYTPWPTLEENDVPLHAGRSAVPYFDLSENRCLEQSDLTVKVTHGSNSCLCPVTEVLSQMTSTHISRIAVWLRPYDSPRVSFDVNLGTLIEELVDFWVRRASVAAGPGHVVVRRCGNRTYVHGQLFG
ncbi:predicted protein [Postia placenta Mad-698-R]|nr:predicted protein [Postia placenta Mad-698-R]